MGYIVEIVMFEGSARGFGGRARYSKVSVGVEKQGVLVQSGYLSHQAA